MKNKISLASISGAALLAILSTASARAGSQDVGPYTDARQRPVYYVIYDVVPGMAQPVADSFETIGMRQARATEKPHRTVMQSYTGLSPAWVGIASGLDALAATGASAKVLEADRVAPSIRTAAFGDRSALLACQMRIQAGENSVDSLQARSVEFSGDTQAEFQDAMREVDVRQARLDRCILAAQHSTPDRWTEDQSNLADAYGRYAEAASRLERLSSS